MNISINKLNHFPDTRYTAQHSVDSKYSEGTFNISTHHSHQHTTECQVEELGLDRVIFHTFLVLWREGDN